MCNTVRNNRDILISSSYRLYSNDKFLSKMIFLPTHRLPGGKKSISDP
jgi:hypothetical protein